MKTASYALRIIFLLTIAIVQSGVSRAQSVSTPNPNMPGPFGFTCGMSQQAITGLVGPLKNEGVNLYTTSTAPNPYPNVGGYSLTIFPTQGLLRVQAETNDIETDSGGADLVAQFHKIETELTKQYGKPTRQDDSLKPGSIWAGQDEWTTSYLKKERTLSSHWIFPNPAGCVTAIELTAIVINPNDGAIAMDFELKGYSAVQPSPVGKKTIAY
jgi:hypothetical protein